MMKRLIYMMTALVAATSCINNMIDEVLLVRDDISLSIREELLMSFDENKCQLGFNSARNEYRVYDENLANWFVLKCSAKPTSEGQKVTVDLEYTTEKGIKTLADLEFSVVQTSSDGLVWLWNKDRKIGTVIKNL
jgi:hypothetical protein